MKKRYCPCGHLAIVAGFGQLGLVAGILRHPMWRVHAYEPGTLARIRQPLCCRLHAWPGLSCTGRGHWCNIRVLITGGPAAAALPRKTGPSRPEEPWQPSCVTANISVPYPRKTKASFAMHVSSRPQNGAGTRLDRRLCRLL